MPSIISKPDAIDKLRILSDDARYDLACACSSSRDEHRVRSDQGRWIYPVSLPNGGRTTLFKTLISNVCENDCKYCPLRSDMDVRRTTLSPEQAAELFMHYYNSGKVFGLFLSSAVAGGCDNTMGLLLDTAALLRHKHGFGGFMHLKVIPGSSKEAVRQAVSLASTVSLNVETPGGETLRQLTSKKDFVRDIAEPIKYISELTAKGQRYERVKQTTQFIVGAGSEDDRAIVKYMSALYDRVKMHRIYFSAYQKGLGDQALPGERFGLGRPDETFVREHRLYQVDFLMRKYRFGQNDILFDKTGRLDLDKDPKQIWADANPGFFPVNLNRAGYYDILRIPGIGRVTAEKILKRRKEGRLNSIRDIGKTGKRLQLAAEYVCF